MSSQNSSNSRSRSSPPSERADSTRPLSDHEESRLFWWLRRRIARTLLRQALTRSRLRVSLLVLLTIVFWLGLYGLFLEGFSLLNSAVMHVPTRAQTVDAVYNVFFLCLFAMLTISAAIILYSGLYRSEEVEYLLTTPVSSRRIVIYKFQEALLFSCWGFFLMGSPMLIAYGRVAGSPWYYYAMLLPMMLAFVLIPVAFGCICCILVVAYLPRARRLLLCLAAAMVLVPLAWMIWWTLGSSGRDILTIGWLNDMLARLRFAEQRLLPSWWLSRGLLEAAHEADLPGYADSWRESVLFFGVLLTNGLLAAVVFVTVAGRLLRPSISRLRGQSCPHRPTRPSAIDQILLRILPLPRQHRLMIIKDVRLFRRDPVQWGQFLIFFGLLSLYFINIRQFQYDQPMQRWMSMIGFLNLGVVGLILSTFTTRFVFPMISLEGRRFWMLASLPVERDTVLWSKFLFACGGAIVPCSALILLSDLMLGGFAASAVFLFVHQITCWTICIGLSAIAVGLGARLPNLREASPSRIATGFGGTLNLVLSAVFIVFCVLFTALPCDLYLTARENGLPAFYKRIPLAYALGIGPSGVVILGMLAVLALGAVATAVPLWLGLKAFRRLEF